MVIAIGWKQNVMYALIRFVVYVCLYARDVQVAGVAAVVLVGGVGVVASGGGGGGGSGGCIVRMRCCS